MTPFLPAAGEQPCTNKTLSALGAGGTFGRLTRKRINQVTLLLLLIGLGSALAVYFTAQDDPDDPLMRQLMASKRYSREMRMIGGQANMDAAAMANWIGSLWHGRNLGVTIAGLSVAGVLLFRFIALHPHHVLPDEPDDKKARPADPT